MQEVKKTKGPFYIILLLILAGEAVFILPFILPRIFRPTVLDVFELTNLELGTCFSVYGIVAFISYVFGGPLADRFQPRILMALALFLTAIGGVVISTYPSFLMLNIIYGYWGFTTIFLFWAALIKATRVWGGKSKQGSAFGFLDGGRGLVAAAFGTLGVIIFSFFVPIDLAAATLTERKEAFSYVILASSGIIVIVGLLVLFFMKMDRSDTITMSNFNSLANFRIVIKIPSVYLLMIIILCAYVGYKLTSDFSLYAREVMLYDEVKSAKIGTSLFYVRAIIGVIIGLLADRFRSSLWLMISFTLMLIGAILFASGIISGLDIMFFISLLVVCAGVFALRTLYFSSMREGYIPLAVTGTAVGLISLVGYTPDIFVGPAMGYLLDNSPGETGHQHVFVMLAIFSVIGLIASIVFHKITLKLSDKIS